MKGVLAPPAASSPLDSYETISIEYAVVVQWPDGDVERWRKPEIDRVLALRRGTGSQ